MEVDKKWLAKAVRVIRANEAVAGPHERIRPTNLGAMTVDWRGTYDPSGVVATLTLSCPGDEVESIIALRDALAEKEGGRDGKKV